MGRNAKLAQIKEAQRGGSNLFSFMKGLKIWPKSYLRSSLRGLQFSSIQFSSVVYSLLAWSLLICVLVNTSVLHLSSLSLKTNEEQRVEMVIEIIPVPSFTVLFERSLVKVFHTFKQVIFRALNVISPIGSLYIVGYSSTDLSPPVI